MTPNQQVLSDEQIKELIPDGDEWKHDVGFRDATEFARAIESAALAALAQQAQEPVAWLVSLPDEPELGEWFSEQDMSEQGYTSKPLYTTPQPQPAPAPVAEREAFRLEWERKNWPIPMNSRLRDDGRYGDGRVQSDWEAYQARAALQSPAHQATKGQP